MNDEYSSPRTRQPALKPQDVAVVLGLLAMRQEKFSFANLAAKLSLSVGEVHLAMKRAALSRLVLLTSGSPPEVVKGAAREFFLHGVRYAFPAVQGALTRGMVTSLAATPARHSVDPEATPSVWPTPTGPTKGYSIVPLYPAAPNACLRDPNLYEMLALIDAIRVGSARERDIASSLLIDLLA